MLRYSRINCEFYTDTFFATSKAGKTTRQNTCAQIFVSDKGFVAIYPMQSKGDFLDALQLFCKEIGVPHTMVMDPSGEQSKKEVKRFMHQVGTTPRYLEENTQWANRAELYIGLFKESIRRDLAESNSPMKLWDYCAERRALIHNATPRNLFQLNGNTPAVATFGKQADISNLCQFKWYQWCKFREENKVQFPFQKVQLGRVLGPMKNAGNEMAQAVLKSNGTVVPRRTCRPLTIAEIESPTEQSLRNDFDARINSRHGDSLTIIEVDDEPIDLDEKDFIVDDDDEAAFRNIPEEDPVDFTGRPVLENPFTDILIHAEVLLPQGEELKPAKVIGRSKSGPDDNEHQNSSNYDPNPLLNSLLYDVQFPDGAVKQYAANVIAENMYAQVADNGQTNLILDAITDWDKNGHAVSKRNKYVKTKHGNKRLRQTTSGWKLRVLWKDGSESWVPLKLMKIERIIRERK